jgi:hypothetical protein
MVASGNWVLIRRSISPAFMGMGDGQLLAAEIARAQRPRPGDYTSAPFQESKSRKAEPERPAMQKTQSRRAGAGVESE